MAKVELSDLRFRGRLFLALSGQGAISVLVFLIDAPGDLGLRTGESASWYILCGIVGVLLAIGLTSAFETSELLWRRTWRRRFTGRPDEEMAHWPKVSIHIPVCSEPPELVQRTLRSVAALDYPDLEVLVISNNTTDESLWRPLERECERLGSRFRFFHLEKWPGYKAGALNYALDHTAEDVDVIGVLDSDYVVDPNWLRSLAAWLEDEQVAVVQAPQDHRGWTQNWFQRMCNWEYRGFFRLGMVQRNERNAIIQHGTMALIRRRALEDVGGWAEWCICADAELGIRLLHAGWQTVYVPERLGWGVVPDSFAAYKKQRSRWAYGAARILRAHWRKWFGEWGRGLTLGQRWHFVAGWLPWLGDAMHLVFSLAMLGWVVGLFWKPQWFALPTWMLILPMLVVGAFHVLRTLWLYQRHVDCGPLDRLGASLAGLALVYPIGKGMLSGLFTSRRPFGRTAKDMRESVWMNVFIEAREELWLLTALWLAAGIVISMEMWPPFERSL